MQNLVISINTKMMQINLKYIRNSMYSYNSLLIVSGHALYERRPLYPFRIFRTEDKKLFFFQKTS